MFFLFKEAYFYTGCLLVTSRCATRGQIHELPETRVQVIEHRVEAIGCPACGHLTVAKFPAGVDAPVQYGSRLRAVAVYLSQFQLLPMERIGELCADLWGCSLSEGTLASWIAEAARTLEPPMLALKRWLMASRVNHVDETGIRIKGLLHWVHVTATKWLTAYFWHDKRGQEATDAIGVLPHYQGRAMHDRWHSYDHYPCQHSVCGAHLLRDCLFVAEHEKQPWAQAMYELLLRMKETADAFRAQGARAVPKAQRDALVLQYFEVLQQGFAAHAALAPPQRDPECKKPGRRRKQDASKNLLDALLKRAEQVLAFLDDLSVPFTNDVVAYCTPSAWLACFVRRVWSLFVGWRKQRNPTAIGMIHGNATSSPPIPDRLWANSIGLCGFTGG